MTEIAIRQEITDYQDQAVRRLTDWARSADAAYQVAEKLVQSSFVPQAFRGKPIEAAAAILAGLECGLQPMAALRSFDVIQGQAAPRAITLRAVVQSYGHEVELVESTATRCRMRGRRRGSQAWQSVAWTIDRARELQLTGKDNWKKQPAAMLVARATSEICRLIAADAILGIGYSAEEVIDGAVGDPEQPQMVDEPAEPTTRRMSYTPPSDEPVENEQPADQPTASAGNVKAITQAQSKMLHALLNEIGCGERNAGLLYISEVVGRDITTSKDLTREEASQVIDQATADKDASAPAIEDVETGDLL